MPITPARTIAFDALLRVETEGAYASDVLHARLNAKVSSRDAALATEIVMGALRWQRLIDFFIERYTSKKIATIDAEVLVALRMGIYQLRFLSRIPANAAVNDSVELVKRARKSSAASLVNAVLRRAARESAKPVEEFLPLDLTPADALGLLHSHPTWLVERWLARFGRAETITLLATNNETPRRACAVISREFREDVTRSLADASVEFEPGRLLRDAITVRSGDIAKTTAFERGWIAIQDEASQMIPVLLDVNPGESVLDVCAAPGGKTLALARAAGPNALVVAADRRENRLRVMRERLARAGASYVKFVALDGTASLPFNSKFHRILIDAPCSGTGTLARNPEIRWKLKPTDLAELHQRQVMLLDSALECLAPHGRLIYSTCSLEPEENESVVSEALRSHPEFQMTALEIPAGVLANGTHADTLVTQDGAFRTFPPLHFTDGFFAAALRRR
ncbi:MAG TPA: 16S rRNA (cytosine(967)-C(5))-methyltransferase RsmB [Candidatus Acidoferrales bacterium]|nr:16S rRNA (cytosine(967)-C(5))-methyltransferase RsmB [Candidatus Acidoferrales bacterium]